ncbi:hypothetical protein CDQ96_04090 [Borrelia miyamotoi]|nr:hypothetical protein CDQ96_04090 [Borrelia miyamotoi]
MINKVFFAVLVYFFLFIWWLFSYYLSYYSAIAVFDIPLWFVLSCIFFPILSLLLVCIFVLFFKND